MVRITSFSLDCCGKSHSGLTHDRFSLGLSPFLRERVVERLQEEAAKGE